MSNIHSLKICLIAPFPPKSNSKNHSCGGIATWTGMLWEYAYNRKEVSFTIIDTLPKWRTVHNFSTWKRILSGAYELMRNIFRLIQILTIQRIDIIHMTTSGQIGIIRDICLMLISKLFRKPVIYHIRFGRISEISKLNTLEWKLMAYAVKLAHTTITIDQRTQSSIKKYLSSAKSILIPNCINLSTLSPEIMTNNSTKKLLFVGWVVPKKGIDELIKAWLSIDKKGWELQIVGPFDETYQNQFSKKYPIKAGNIHFTGEKSHKQVINYMASCDLFVLPSYTEGFPNVILEAMILGKPIIATEVGAIPEMLGENCGLLVKPRDVTTLKNAIQKLINDNDMCVRIASNAKEKALGNYTIDAVFSQYLKAWHQALLS